MAADSFTEAARAEAERRFDFLSDASCFEQGAEWARTHLAAQESDAERAVRALHERAWHGELDYCPRCVDYEGAFWPCRTIEALDSARAARRDGEKR